jgi:acetyl-CoA carboxylase carboxyltransferase component
VLTIVAKQKAGDAFNEEAFAPIRDAFEKQVEDQSTALFSTGRLWDDGIIDPRDTRTVLGLALSATHSGPVEGTSAFGIWRM